jgi:hypothetical protein
MKYIIVLFFSILCFESKSQALEDCSNCSTQLVNEAQIKGISIDEIGLLTNEILARNGYNFGELSVLQNFFEEKSWYNSKNDNKSVLLNEIEKNNIKLFQDKAKELKNNQKYLIKQLKTFKNLIINNKKEELKTKFGFHYEEDNILIKEVLNKINLDDINYYKSKGLNSITTDNGFVQILYEISIEKENVNVFYNYMSHSKIIEGIDVFTDYQSENEFMLNWQFEFKNKKLKFIKLEIAG